jgi:ABC-type uncharacterized transport system auxiliary subunit
MKAYKSTIALAGTFLLNACMPSFTSSQAAPAIYSLHGPAPKPQVKESILHVIAIHEPTVPAGFDTDKIALYLYNKRRLDYYNNAVWPERLGKVLQEVVLQSTQEPSGIMAVAADSGFPATDEVWIKVNDFEPIYAAGPTEAPFLKASLSFRLVSLANRQILFDATYSAGTPAAANTQSAIVSGLEALLTGIDKKAFREIGRAL